MRQPPAIMTEQLLDKSTEPRATRPGILVVSSGPVGRHMAGPAIRSVELAGALARAGLRVTLLTPNQTPPSGDGFEVRSHAGREGLAVAALDTHDVLLCQGYTLSQMPALARLGKCLVLDLYDPFPLENLHVYRGCSSDERQRMAAIDVAFLNTQLLLGDFFLCASERQRDFWLGLLAANGRLSPGSFDLDPSFRRLIDVVPFGVPARVPAGGQPVLKGVTPGIAREDEVVLWGGGAWDWLDPVTAVEAMSRLRHRRPRARLVFLGVRSPDSTVKGGSAVKAAQALARRLELDGRSVFFRSWTPYADREGFLLEADVGLSLHGDHLESHFAMRSRLLDCVWAGLPMVLTRGDVLADKLAAAGVARLVEPASAGAVADAIEALLEPGTREGMAGAFGRLRDEFSWDKAAGPLIRYCQDPVRAPDNLRAPDRFREWPEVASGGTQPLTGPWWTLPLRAMDHLRRGGIQQLRLAAADHLRRRRLEAARRQ